MSALLGHGGWQEDPRFVDRNYRAHLAAHDPSVRADAATSPVMTPGRRAEPERRSGRRLPAGVEAHLRGMIGAVDALGDQLDIVRLDGLVAIGPVHDLLAQLEVQGRELRAMLGEPPSPPPCRRRGGVAVTRDGGVMGNTTAAHDPSVAADGDTSPHAQRVGRRHERDDAREDS